MNRITIAPVDQCEMCHVKSLHFTKKGIPTDFDAHHMYGAGVVDSVLGGVRACGRCHNAVTRKARGGTSLNEDAKKRVLEAETNVKALILEALQNTNYVLTRA